MNVVFLRDKASKPVAQLLLAHGAGAPMDHPWMNDMAGRLIGKGIDVGRFEFGFMAGRRDGGKRQPAPRGDKLVSEYLDAVRQYAADANDSDNLPLFIGGKSLGGRVASLAAEELYSAGTIRGVICFGYPFHPANKPETLRTAHLATFDCPMLILQGTRDPLGRQDEVSGYHLDKRIELNWLNDGDHDLKPRKKSGETLDGHLSAATDSVATFVQRKA